MYDQVGARFCPPPLGPLHLSRVVGRVDGPYSTLTRAPSVQGAGGGGRGTRALGSGREAPLPLDGLITTLREISHSPQRRDAVATGEGSHSLHPCREDMGVVATGEGSHLPRGRGRPRHIPAARAWASLQLAMEAARREGVGALATSPPRGRGCCCNWRRKPLAARPRLRLPGVP